MAMLFLVVFTSLPNTLKASCQGDCTNAFGQRNIKCLKDGAALTAAGLVVCLFSSGAYPACALLAVQAGAAAALACVFLSAIELTTCLFACPAEP